MGREATGTIEYVDAKPGEAQGRWKVRISLLDGARPWITCDPSPKSPQTEARAREKAAHWSERARRERLTAAGFGLVAPLVKTRARAEENVAEWSVRWLAEREARGLTSVGEDRSRLRLHVLPHIGEIPIRKVAKLDLERLVQTIDDRVRAGELGWKTALHAWSLVSSMFRDAAASKRLNLRVRDDNPAAGVAAPDKGANKAKVYLYPSEFSKLVACAEVPLEWRRLFAVAVYTYARAGELRALTWGEDVDLERGVIHIHRSADRNTGKESTTKTEQSRRIPIEAELLPLLTAMREEAGGLGRLFPWVATDRKLSRQIQRCLRLAGVDRAELFASDATRKPMTFHDLRANGITWCAVRGDDPLKIKQRAGHASFSTTEGYIRTAENLADANFGSPFPPLPAALLGGAGGDEIAGGEDEGGAGEVSGESSEDALEREKEGGGAGNRIIEFGVLWKAS